MTLFIHREHSDRGCIAMNDIADRPTVRSLRHRRLGRIARHTINVATANNLAARVASHPPRPPGLNVPRHADVPQLRSRAEIDSALADVPSSLWRSANRRSGAPAADGRGPTLLCRPAGLPSVPPSMPFLS